MRDDEFEWDDDKAERNLRDHRITFEMARDAFADPFAIAAEDERFDYDEDRFSLIGMVNGRLLSVGYVYRSDRIRIITARGAERHERRRYHEANRD